MYRISKSIKTKYINDCLVLGEDRGNGRMTALRGADSDENILKLVMVEKL